jgi:hypothetical protein
VTQLVFPEAGEVIDPSYPTTIIPLVAVPVISLLTREHVDGRDAFFAKLAPAPR